ncbi:Hpt domain-containing protein [Planctomycetes bacterium K23_9]|uniref:Hpt domain protein n=1 Tax=Stieleria marina TaxID=1930275 RepID=A0A517P3E6_9BACT|nr:Hpt domain protein [Planctomycetes bacterium K23_9]
MTSDLDASTDNDPIDLNEACEMFGGDRQLLRSIVEAFLMETPGMMKTIDGSLESGDAKAIVRAAHTMKSNFSNLCLHETAKQCRDVEDFAKQNNLTEIKSSLDALQVRLQTIVKQLEAYLAS